MNKHPISVDRCLSGGYILATMINGIRFKIRYIDYSLAEVKAWGGLKLNRAYALQLRDDAIYKARLCLDYLTGV